MLCLVVKYLCNDNSVNAMFFFNAVCSEFQWTVVQQAGSHIKM